MSAPQSYIDRITCDVQKLLEDYTNTIDEVKALVGEEMWARVAAEHQRLNNLASTEPTEQPLEQEDTFSFAVDESANNGFTVLEECDRIELEQMQAEENVIYWEVISDDSISSTISESVTEDEETSEVLPEVPLAPQAGNINEDYSEEAGPSEVSGVISVSERLKNFFGSWNEGRDAAAYEIHVPEKSELRNDPQFSLNKTKSAPQKAKKLPKKVAQQLKKDKKEAKKANNRSSADDYDYLVNLKKEITEKLIGYLTFQKEIRENLTPLKIFQSPPMLQAILLLIKPISLSTENHVRSYLDKRQHEHKIAGCDRLTMFYSALSELLKDHNYTEVIVQDIAYMIRKHSDDSGPEVFAQVEACYYFYAKEDTNWQDWDFVPAHLKKEFGSATYKDIQWDLTE